MSDTPEAWFREGDRLDLTERDPVAAMALIERAANAGLPAAQTRLGMAYQCGRGKPRDYEAAAALYRQAANQGDVRAAMLHDLLMSTGLASPQGLWTFYTEAVRRRDLHVTAWPDALLAMGLIDLAAYRDGAAVLAELGHVSPAAFLDGYEAQGLITPRERVTQLRKLAREGDELAARKLGELYAVKLYEGLDDDSASRWLLAAGEQLEPTSDLAPVWDLLGRLILDEVITGDAETAYFYLGLAQVHGDDASAVARADLGDRLDESARARVQQRIDERLQALSGAGVLARLGARVDAGDAGAALQAGIFCELGITSEVDPAAAAAWYHRAAALGSPAALNHLAGLRSAYAFDYDAPPEEDDAGGGS
jgi:TPR repeat protein